MSKVISNKIKLALFAVLFAIVFACAGIMMFAKAENQITVLNDVSSFSLSGSELIVEGDDGINGLKFTATISADEYDGLMALVGEDKTYASVETGLIIMPIYYMIEQDLGYPSEDALFGENAVYDWAVWNGSEYVYTESTKTRVININANKWVKDGDVYKYSGAIVDVLDHNETICFFSTAYVRAQDASGVVSYLEATDTAASSTSVSVEVEKAYASMTDEQKAWVDANWTKHTPVEAADMMLEVTGVTEVEFSTFTQDIVNDTEALLKIGMLEPDEIVLTDNYGTKTTITIDSAEEEPKLTITDNLLREFTLDFVCDGVVIFTRKVDFVDTTKGFVWSDLSETKATTMYRFTSDAANSTSEDHKIYALGAEAEVATIDKDGASVSALKYTASQYVISPGHVWVSIAPLHSKAYYDAYKDMGITLNVSAYFDVDEGASGYNQLFVKGVYKEAEGEVNGWFNVSYTLEDLLEGWNTIVDFVDAEYSWSARSNYGMFYLYNPKNADNGNNAIYLTYGTSVDVSEMSAGDILVKLDDVADKTQLNLTSYMNSSDVAKIQAVAAVMGVTYEMKGCSIADTIAVTDLTSVDVSEAKEAAYVLTVKCGDVVIYTATFDLYTSTSPVVWAESMTEYNVILRKTAYQVGWPNKVTGTLVAGTDYEFVDSLSVGSSIYTKSYVKVTVNEAMNVALDIKALHTKAYYQEMSDLTKVLHIRGYFPQEISTDMNYGQNNYGMNNAYSSWRSAVGSSTPRYESIVISMDNYLIASNTNTASGKYYDWTKISGGDCGSGNTMMQFEIPASKASEDNPFVFYLGDVSVEAAGETLINNASKYINTTIDISDETTSFDLTNVIPESQRAKLTAMAKAWGETVGKRSASCVGFNLTINGTVHSVKPDAEGRFMLDLDDYVVAEDGTVSSDQKVRDLLSEGNNTVKIFGYAPPVTSMGLSAWPVYMAVEGTLTIVGPAMPEFDWENYNMTQDTISVEIASTINISELISTENAAKLQELEDAGYTLTWTLENDTDVTTLTSEDLISLELDEYVWGDTNKTYALIVKVIDGQTEHTVFTGSISLYE